MPVERVNIALLTPDFMSAAEFVRTLENLFRNLDGVRVEDSKSAKLLLDEKTQTLIADALTNAELFASYGLTQKAIGMLEANLLLAPLHTQTLEKLLDLLMGTGDDRRSAEIASLLERINTEHGDSLVAEHFGEVRRRFQRVAGLTENEPHSASPVFVPPSSVQTSTPTSTTVPDASVLVTTASNGVKVQVLNKLNEWIQEKKSEGKEINIGVTYPPELPSRLQAELSSTAAAPATASVPDLVPLSSRRSKPSHASVQVFYATDRNSSGPTFDKTRSANGSLSFGVCEVSIPRDHRMGLIERPSILKLEFSEDPDKHITLQKLTRLETTQFWQCVRDRTKTSETNEAFVFVHGYCTTFEDAILRTGQIAYDLGFSGAPICYSWPSQGDYEGYVSDETDAQWSVPHLQGFLKDLVKSAGIKTLHLVAHSMGNRIVSQALQLLHAENLPEVCHMRQIVLTAPDIDADTFKQMAASVKSLSDRVTIYCSSRDKALALSKRFHGYPRLGDAPLPIDGVDTIDASEVDTSFIGHSYFGNNRSVLSDIFWLLRENKSPRDRFGMKVITEGTNVYYAFRP